ncbi:2685_t:CDS:10 [Diversispora eburnea]|uniref:2685_t:CDS:1 n=1 Tax=Diversispora eburnea TaxID=1213867 RepID=A0A9N9G4V6_9GLOM|nr:2685_t:CDS:10 [Diversispora eburnea]
MVDYREVLRNALASGFGIVRFFKIVEYRFSQRDQAERDLKRSLEEIASENGELSPKAQEILRNFDTMIKKLSVERYWSSAKVNEEREKTRSEKIISNEREEQHFFNLKSNIAMEHDVASNSFRTQILERLNKKDSIDEIGTFFQDPSDQRSTKFIEKLQESEIISDDSDEIFNEEDEAESQNSFSASKNDNDPDYILSDTDKSTSEDDDDLDCNNDHISKKDSPKIDKVAFQKTHDAIPDTVKLKLSTGKIVEDVLFKFCKNKDYEHHTHSYIVDFDDKDVKALFTDEEWNELTKDRIEVPSFPRDIAEELAKYGSKSLKELRTKVMKSYLKEEEEYDVHKHYNREWIQMTMRTLCNLYENVDTPLVRTQYEDWFTVALFGTCIDFCIRDAQLGTDTSRNRAIEGARAFAGVSDNKYLLESFKMPKTLRDIYTDLIKAVNFDEQKADKLQVFGILHFGLYIQFARLWRAGGSICIFRKDPQSFYVDSKFSKNGLSSFIRLLKKIYQFKIMIKNNLQILNILNNGDDDTESEDLLKELLEDEQYSTPPLTQIKFFAECENTPKKKKKKRSNSKEKNSGRKKIKSNHSVI